MAFFLPLEFKNTWATKVWQFWSASFTRLTIWDGFTWFSVCSAALLRLYPASHESLWLCGCSTGKHLSLQLLKMQMPVPLLAPLLSCTANQRALTTTSHRTVWWPFFFLTWYMLVSSDSWNLIGAQFFFFLPHFHSTSTFWYSCLWWKKARRKLGFLHNHHASDCNSKIKSTSLCFQ